MAYFPMTSAQRRLKRQAQKLVEMAICGQRPRYDPYVDQISNISGSWVCSKRTGNWYYRPEIMFQGGGGGD